MRVSLRRAGIFLLFAACLLDLAGWWAPTSTLALVRFPAYAPAPEAEQERKKESRELIYKFINLSILVGALTYLLRKPLADFFSQRSDSIRRSLEDGRKALAASQGQLKAVEEKLALLAKEIEDFKASAAREMEGERQRLKEVAADEADKILQAARAQTEVAVRAARLELKMYAAQHAIELAEQIIRGRLDEAGRKKLVAEFLKDVQGRDSRN